uniref:Mucin-5AC n=1 Tax=Anopheles farauti TaxID=69004 RepID=A0A182QH52_9DIPT
MDYIGRTMNICLILFTIFITGNHCQYYNNRDIILTPNQLKTYPGKVLYYRPREQVPSEGKPNTTGDSSSGSAAVPWEEVLKETVFLTLNDNKTSLQQLSSGSTENAPTLANRQQKAIYSAPYLGVIDLTVPRFGDIVELAHGRLEREGDDAYFFVQQDGKQRDDPEEAASHHRNVSAWWKVERIRHRDEQRGHRFELKITVATNASAQEADQPQEGHQEQREVEPSNNRTYIIRDEDYPKYFAPINAISPNAIPMHRKNDQAFDRTFFDLLQPQGGPHQFAPFAPATRFYRPAPQQQPQQTITLGQYLVQSLLSGGEAPKFHHHHHHYGKLPAAPGFFGPATSNRIKFPDSFTGSSHSVPKFYQHIHFQRPSIAPLAPTALPGSYLFHHPKDSHAPAPSNIHQDFAKLQAASTASPRDPPAIPDTGKPTKGNTVAQKVQSTTPNHILQPHTVTKTSPKPQQFPTQHHQQQFHQQIATTSAGTAGPQLTVAPSQNSLPQAQQFPAQGQYPAQHPAPHPIYRPQVPPPQQLQPILIPHPHVHPQVAGPPGFFPPPSHLIQSIPFYNPQGQMVVNHIPVMSNHHMIQMSPPQPIAIPVHVQLIPPVGPAAQGHLFAAPPQQQGQQQGQQGQQQLHPHQPDGLQAIPVRIMQPIPNPVHLYSPINPFLPPLQAQQHPFHHHHHHHQHHPIITVTPKTTSSSSSPATSPSSSSSTSTSPSSPVTINYQHHQRHPPSSNHSTVTPTAGHLTQTSPQSPNHPHTHPHPHPHPHPQAHSFNVIPTVFKFTSSNAIPHPQKTTAVSGGTAGTHGGSAPLSTPTATTHHHQHHPHHPHHPHPHHRFQTPNVQLSGPSISPAAAHRNRNGNGKQSPAPSSTAAAGSAAPTSATRPSARYTPAVGQVSGPTVSSTAANHRYAPLPTVPASPAGLREKFTAPAFQPAASESKQTSRKLEPPAAGAGAGGAGTISADAVGSPSNAVSPKYESFGVENAVTPTPPSESLLLSATSPATVTGSSLSQSHHFASPTPASSSSSAARTTLAGGSAFSYTNFVDVSGAVSVTAKLTASAEQTASSSPAHPPRSSSSAGSPSPTAPVSVTTQATYVPPAKSYIQQLGPTIGVKYPPAFKSMPSVTIIPPQIETPISSTLKTYQYLNHHDTYDFIPSRVVELAHVKKMNGQKHAKRTKAQKGPKMGPQKPNGAGGGLPPPPPPPPPAQPAPGAIGPIGPNGNHHHHVTVMSNKPLRFYPGDGPEYATHRPEAQLSVQLPPPEKDYAMTYYGTPKHNQKVQRPKNFVTPLHAYGGSSTTPIPSVAVAVSPASLTASPSSPSFVSSPASSTTVPPSSQQTTGQGKNATNSTFRSATASSTAHYYKNRNEKSDDLTTMSITTMRPRVMLKTIYRQFPGSFVSTSTSTSTEKPVQKWVPKRPRSSTKSTVSGERFSTSTLPSASHPVSIEQAVASSEQRPVDVVTKNPVVVTVRSNVDQQMQRVRASRGRSRYTYRRIPSGNPPPIPTGQQATTAHSQSMRTSRMRNSNFSTTTTTTSASASASATSTTTTKPIIMPSATSSVFDSNRIDGRSFEQQERKAEEAVMTAATKNESNEKIKRDIGEVSEEKGRETTVAAAAEELVVQQAENQQDPLEVTEPEKEYVMVKATISEPIATNHSHMVMFEASDAVASSAGEQPGGRSIGSAFDELTMSIINHAKAIVNQTEKPAPVTALEEVLATASAMKSIESNEIAHKDEPEPETTVEVTTTTVGSTSTPTVTESTVSETIGTTTNEDAVGGGDDTVDASQTTVVAVESA